ncbi:mechanosensitive ion channel family protein [Candidatus Cyanaurora vandensis]|uniref:mechanosensitive ion channel family protein n=1 Tax=Candidatus Cyanaurora vandensis TaxID=2714958 RepID=UPI00257EBB85|nr:mechanosensitive ion channel family protein [Candidatus Cyanaurora vandensis]
MNPELQAWLERLLAVLWLPGSKVALLLVGSYLLLRGIDFALDRLRAYADDKDPAHVSDAEKRVEKINIILRSASRVIIVAIVVVNILEILGINIGPLLTGAGVVGVVIGFGAQSLVRDLLAGLFVVFEDQYRLGDVVRVDALTGTVERMGLRTTILRDLNGSVHIIPNGSISRVTVLTREWSRALLDIRVGYQHDLSQIEQLLQQVGQSLRNEDPWRNLTLEDLQVLGVEDLAENAVIIRVMMKTLPGKQWEVMRELRRRIKQALTDENIPIPFPQFLLPPAPDHDP